MSVINILNKLKNSGIRLFREEGRLKMKAAPGLVTPQLLEEIRTYKKELLDLLAPYDGMEPLISPAPSGGDYPVSSQQESLWILCQHPEQSISYNIPMVLRIAENADLHALEQAFHDITRRHEVFRTGFFQTPAGEVRQRILDVYPAIRYKDMSVEDIEDEDELKALISEECRHPFDLATAPLIRAAVYRRENRNVLLIITTHHIIFDGVSFGIFRKELMEAYYLRKNNHVFSPPALQLTYKDFSVWEYQRRKSSSWSREIAFWEEKLSGRLPEMQLIKSNRPKVRTNAGDSIRFTFSRELSSSLQAFCYSLKVSPFAGLLAGLNALFYKYTGQRDLLIGTVAMGREYPSLQSLIGLFINTVPLRSTILPEDPFDRWLEAQHLVLEEALKHEIPFNLLVEKLNKERNISRSAIVDILAIYNDDRGGGSDEDAGDFEFVGEDFRSTSHYDLSFLFYLSDDGLSLTVEFNTDVYGAETIRQLAGHYMGLLSDALSRPQQPVGRLEYLPAAERDCLLTTFKGPSKAYPPHTFLDMFAETVRRWPDNIALSAGDIAFNFRQLDQLSDGVAGYLQERYDIQVNDLIGIQIPRSEWVIIIMMGILKAGGAYVPIDMSYPGERVAYIIKDSGCRLMIDGDELTSIQEWLNNPVYGGRKKRIIVTPNDLVYVIYTSGSTGRPKGALINHGNLYNYLIYFLEELWIPSGLKYKVPLFSSLSFDLPVTAVYCALVTGGELAIYPQEMNASEAMEDIFFGNKGFTFIKCTPTHLSLLQNKRKGRTTVAEVVAGGEELTTSHLSLLRSLNPEITLYNEYGPTEATVACTVTPILLRGIPDKCVTERLPGTGLPIGKPIGNSWIYILDGDRQLLPLGVCGEIYIGGAGVALGYLGRPDLTAEKFLEDPFHPGGKVYRTGDMGRWLPDGNLEYLGRIDEQVKIRGYRIEPMEVEQALGALEGIESAAVVVHTGKEGDRYLVGYVVSGSRQEGKDLRRKLLSQLPEYMVPNYFIQMEELPVTANGKLDKRMLPVPEVGVAGGIGLYEAPRTEAEWTMARIWQSVLGVERLIGLGEDFFSLGGHSLRVMQLINEYEQCLGVRLTMQEAFYHTTIADHSKLLMDRGTGSYYGICRVEKGLDYAVSEGQRRLWVMSQEEEASRAYHLRGSLRLKGRCSVESWQRAMGLAVRRHEILRTVFRVSEGGDVRQVVLGEEDSRVELERWCITGRSGEEVAAEVWRWSSGLFDLERGPLFRVLLVEGEDEGYRMYYTMHHIIGDGWSLELLGREVLGYYDLLVRGEAVVLEPLLLQYKDYAFWQLERLSGNVYEENRRYWLRQLGGELPVLLLPAGKGRSAVQAYEGRTLCASLGEDLWKGLEKLGLREGSTMFMVLLAGLKVLLHRYTGQEDIIVGSPVAGRGHAELEDQIGFYINTLALRTEVKGNERFVDLLKKVREVTVGGYAHQEYPFDRLVEELGGRRDRSRSALFDVFLNYQPQLTAGGSLSAEEPEGREGIWDGGRSAAKLDWLVNIHKGDKGGWLYVEYNSGLYERELMERMIVHYKEVLRAVVEEPEMLIGDFSYMGSGEVQEVLGSLRGEVVPKGEGYTLLDIWSASVESYNDRVALRCGEEVMSYGEVDRLSEGVRMYLREERGVVAGQLVGVSVDRSDWLVVLLLGIWKGGWGYVAVDPAYPEERRRYMQEDSGCVVMVDEGELGRMRAWVQSGEWRVENSASVHSEQVAYVLYTSGSTGRPKGVTISHGNLYAYIRYCGERYFKEGGSKIGLWTSLSFDLTVTSLYGWMMGGGELRVYGGDQDVRSVLEEMMYGGEGITFLKCTPAHIGLLEGLERGDRRTGVRQVVVGGEALLWGHIRRLRELLGEGVIIYNEYGPTETTVGCVVEVIDGTVSLGEGGVSIGRAIPGMWLRILDSNGRQVGRGITGELAIGGVQVGQGYWGRAELTSGRFVSDAYGEGRLYLTGDLCRQGADGRLWYMGRRDDQVKVHGHRIELGEVEAVMSGLEGVEGAAVRLQQEAEGEGYLVGYVVGSRGEQEVMREEELLQQLRERLPVYMVPRRIVRLDQLPVTANGKIDRKALSLPEDAGTSRNRAYEAPRSKEEKDLSALWVKLFKQETIGIYDNFFELGGDSIRAILLASQLKQRGYKVRVGDILKYPVLEELAGRLQVSVKESVEKEEIKEGVLTPVQRWFFEEHKGELDHYNQSVMLYSPREIESMWIKGALSAVVGRHDALRTWYQRQEGGWKPLTQREETAVHEYRKEAAFYGYREEDLRGRSDERAALLAACEAVQESLKLEGGPVLQAGLFRMEDGYRLLLVIHHLAVDGVSWRILLEELATAYGQLRAGSAVELGAVSDTFAGWSVRQQRYANSAVVGEESGYWREVLSKVPAALPVDHPEGSNLQKDLSSFSFTLSREMTGSLRTEVNGVYHTELSDILLTGLLLAIREVWGRSSVLLTLEGHGREELEEGTNVTRTVGWFTTLYPVVLTLSGEEEREALVGVKEQLREVPGKGIGYGMLRYLREDGMKLEGASRPADVLFNYLGDLTPAFGEGMAEWEYDPEGPRRHGTGEYKRDHALTVTGMILSDKLHIDIGYSREQYGEERIKKLSECFEDRLQGLIRRLKEEHGSFKTPADLTYRQIPLKTLWALQKEGAIDDIYELSPMQNGIYYHWLVYPETRAYINQVSYRVSGELDIARLSRCYKQVIQRHSALRTNFDHRIARTTVQVVRKDVKADINYVYVPDEDREEAIRRYKEEDRSNGFDLCRETPMRLSVLELGGGEYTFIWTFHHIILDGWCMSILLEELHTLYDAKDREGRLPDMPYAYADYIRWLRRVDRTKSAGYWKGYLEGYGQSLELPFAMLGNQQPGRSFGVVRSVLGPGLVGRLRGLCRRLGVTENSFLQAAWGYLLSRYNDCRDVVFGAVVSGRPGELEGVEKMVGLFINTIPVRVRYEAGARVDQLLREVQQAAIDSLPHHYLDLSEVQGQSGLRQQLFDHILVYENYPVEERLAAGMSLMEKLIFSSPDISEETNYDFVLIMAPEEDRLLIKLQYNEYKWEERDARRIAGHLERVLEGFLSAEDGLLEEVDYVGAEERRQLLETFNATKVDYPSGRTLQGMFREQARIHREEKVLIYKGRAFSYGELDEWSDRLSWYLRVRRGVCAGELVGVQLHRSEWMIIALLGVLKTGGAYVPIDPDYPAERIAYLREDSGCRVCIDEEELNKFREEQEGYEHDGWTEEEGEGALAYVLYTSGSTGRPKGCMLEQRGVVNRLEWMWREYGFGRQDVVLQKTRYTFDVSVWEIWLPLSWGCRMVLCEDGDVYAPDKIVDLVSRHGVSCMHFVPGMLTAFMENMFWRQEEVLRLKSLRCVMASGEALGVQAVRRWYSRMSAPLNNLYGPTEASIDVSYHRTSEEEERVPIGRPVANTQLYILDGSGRLAGVGVKGEIYIGGVQVGRGYLGRPDLTSARFVADPYGEGRLYRTGDLGRWLPEGEIEYLGRADDQVKIRGYRIELGEVEAVLNGMEGIDAAAVRALKGEDGQKYLAAYVVSGSVQRASKLRASLQQLLPGYMVPAFFIQVERLPVTANGKVDKARLPQPEEQATRDVAYVAPRNEVETTLVEIWKEVLETQKDIGIKDNFFALGGHSIKAIQVISRICEAFKIELSVQELMKEPSIEHLADNILNTNWFIPSLDETVRPGRKRMDV